MIEFITLADIQEYKGISSNVNSIKELIPHILEAQEFDLRPFMGESFYLELSDKFATMSPTVDVEYYELFNGKRYTYNNHEYEFQGIKAVLIYQAYARYLTQAGTTSTATGFVHKTSQYSEKISDKAVTRLIEQARSGAMVYQNRVQDYLNRFSSDYPLYKCYTPKKYRNGIKARKIS